MIFDVSGSDVYGEAADGFCFTAVAVAPSRRGNLPMLGVEDYVYICTQRRSGEYRKGPFGADSREPTPKEIDGLRDAVRAMLASFQA